MADKQISQLVAAMTLNNEDLLVIQQGQIAKKLSGERLAMFVYSAAGSMIDEVNSAVEEAQAAVDELLEEKNAIAQTIADMAGLGTDTTLTTPAMAADAKAVGDRIADVEKDALAGLNEKTISDIAIASFDDGGDDAPVKELIVNIDPVQDLHGQDAPYPAGGGKNKWNPLSTPDVNGTYWAWYIPFQSSMKITLTDNDSTADISGCYFGVSTEGTSGGIEWFVQNGSINTRTKLFTTKHYICVYIKSEEVIQKLLARFNIMVAVDADINASYSPVANICPITGWTGANVYRTWKNLLDPNAVEMKNSTASNIRPCFYFTKAGTYYVKANVAADSGTYLSARIKSADGTYGSASQLTNDATVTVGSSFTITEGDTLIVFDNTPTHTLEQGKQYFSDCHVQLELGSSATAYEAYSGTTISVTFPFEAGTVYGARLNLTTGKLIVDTAVRQFDGSGDVYSFVSNGRVNIDFAGIDYKKGLDKDSGISNSYAGLMQTANNTNFDSSAINYASCYNISASDNNFTVRIKDPRFVDLNTAQAILEEEPLVIIFNLNTPIVYNLTPIEVRTLLKINNIWANTGNINTLIYRTIPITEEVIREIMGDYEEIIAGVEYTGKATKNYYAGNLVIVNDILYKCLVNVASGETFTPGAGGNVSQTTIADELATLQALYDNLGNLALLSYTTA